MSVLGELQPNKVFQYFEEICAIPHGSRNGRFCESTWIKIQTG